MLGQLVLLVKQLSTFQTLKLLEARMCDNVTTELNVCSKGLTTFTTLELLNLCVCEQVPYKPYL